MNHEQELIAAFVLPEKRTRYLGFVSHPKHRKTLLDGLLHSFVFVPTCVVQIPTAEQDPNGIANLLRASGAGAVCHVISELRELDGQEMELREALDLIVGSNMATILSCLLGRLAYFEAEGMKQRHILPQGRPAS